MPFWLLYPPQSKFHVGFDDIASAAVNTTFGTNPLIEKHHLTLIAL